MTRWVNGRMVGEKEALTTKYDTVIKIALIFFYFLAAGFASTQPEDPTVSSRETIFLTQAKIILTDSDSPPPDSALWQPQSLPDNWNA